MKLNISILAMLRQCTVKQTVAVVVMTVLGLVNGSVLANYSDKVLVIVNEDVITQSELDYRLNMVRENLKKNNQQVPAEELKKQILDSMISDKLQLQEVVRRGLQLSDSELEESIRAYAEEQSLTVGQLRQKVVQEGSNFAVFKESIRESILLSRLSDYYARTQVSVPEYEIDGFIAQNNMQQNEVEYEIAHILIKKPEQNSELANRVLVEINDDGLSFEQAALQYSEAGDAKEGGLIGWRKLPQLPEVFANAIKDMQAGDVSDVLSSSNGLHILKVLNYRGKRNDITQTGIKHILVNAEGSVAIAQAKKKINGLRQRMLNGEGFSQLARIYSDDSVSAANGGDLGWVSPRETVPEFEAAFDQLKLNEISYPVVTQYGVHLIQVYDRRQKNIDDRLMRARAEDVLRRQRTNREFGQWVRQLREQAYIEYVGLQAKSS